MDAVMLLVDDHHGQYCSKVLVESYAESLCDSEGNPLAKEILEALSGEDWCEEWDHSQIFILNSEKVIWSVDFMEGGIFAIHPDAEWNEEEECYAVA